MTEIHRLRGDFRGPCHVGREFLAKYVNKLAHRVGDVDWVTDDRNERPATTCRLVCSIVEGDATNSEDFSPVNCRHGNAVSEASHSGLGLPDSTCAGEAKPEHTQKAHSIQLVTFGGNNSLKSVVRRPRISSGYRLGQLGSENWEDNNARHQPNKECIDSAAAAPVPCNPIDPTPKDYRHMGMLALHFT